MYKLKTNFQTGFSLVELSIVLIIISLLLSGALSLLNQKTEADQLSETEEKIQIIEKAIAHFIIENKRLPCPADPDLTKSDSSYGLEQMSGLIGLPDPAVCVDSFGTGTSFNSGEVVAGIVPVKTLQIDDFYIFDGWNHKFTYVVDQRFANNVVSNPSCISSGQTCFQYTTPDSSGITIQDGTGADIVDNAILVILSHGKNGHGSFTRSGGSSRINAGSTDSDEQENSHLDEAGVHITYDRDFVLKSRTANPTIFDDVLYYYTKEHLISLADGVTETSLCSLAETAATDVCPSAANVSNCEAIAQEITNFCLQ